MDEFAKSLTSLSWWLGVVLVGILLNVLSAYLKPAVDNLFSKVSSWWRNRSEEARGARTQFVAELRSDRHKQILMLAEENRKRLRSIGYLICSLILLVLYSSVKISASSLIASGVEPLPYWIRKIPYWASLLVLFFGLIEHQAAERCRSLVAEAQVGGEHDR